MLPLAAVALGALAGIGVFAVVLGLQARPVGESDTQAKLRAFKSRASSVELSASTNDYLLMAGLGGAFGFGAWYATGWVVAGLLGVTAGVMGPVMWRAPRKRQDFIAEIEAYSQWTEQVRDLVAASGSLFEAVTLSAEQAPMRLRQRVVEMASHARTVGLPPALDRFAEEMDSPFADRLVLGMKIAWDSGARVGEAFDDTAKAMRAEVEMRRRNEVANARAWTQVVSMVGVTVGSVLLMFVFNKGFFDPFGSVIGQTILLTVGVLIFGNVFWVMKLSQSGVPVRLLASGAAAAKAARAAEAAAASEEH